MIGFLKKLFKHRDDAFVSANPCIHHFPNVGADGEITINCVITPTARAAPENTLVDEQANGRRHRVTTKRVGTMEVELDEFGLCFKWKPAKMSDDFIRFPSLKEPRTKPPADPAEKRRNDCNVEPLERAEVDVHGETPNGLDNRRAD